MEKVEISFSDLRKTTESVINFIKTEYWWDNDYNLDSEIENDLGIFGDDAEELMIKFSEKYKVDLNEFEFDKYFSPEGSSVNPLLLPIQLLVWVIFIIDTLLSLFLYTFQKLFKTDAFKLGLTISFTKRLNSVLKRFWPRQRERLTVRDLITSALIGKFLIRKYVNIKFKKAAA